MEASARKIQIFAAYQLIFHGVIISTMLIFSGSQFVEIIARCWIMILVLSPNMNLLRPYWASVLLTTLYLLFLFLFYSWFFYGYLSLRMDDAISGWYLLLASAGLFILSGVSKLAAKLIFGTIKTEYLR